MDCNVCNGPEKSAVHDLLNECMYCAAPQEHHEFVGPERVIFYTKVLDMLQETLVALDLSGLSDIIINHFNKMVKESGELHYE